MALSPMMQQYLDIREKYPETIILFRLGDFYEMFFDDAIKGSEELELTLTGRDCGLDERAPMCGVPYHSCESYISRLIKKGYRVSVCEQTEDPTKSKKSVTLYPVPTSCGTGFSFVPTQKRYHPNTIHRKKI